MREEEFKAYQEQISSLNSIIIDLQEEVFAQKQNVEILENDLIDLESTRYKDYKTLFEESPDAIIIIDNFGRIKDINNLAEKFFSSKKYTIIEKPFRKFLEYNLFKEFSSQFFDFIKDPEKDQVVFHFLKLKNNKTFSLVLKKIKLDKLTGDTLIIGIINPYDEKNSQNSSYLSHIVLDQLKDGIIITDEKAKILKINSAFIEITGFNSNEVLGKTPSILKSGRHSKEFYRKMWYSLTHHGWWSGEVWNKRKNGEIYPEWLQINKVVEPLTKKVFYTSVISDISEKKKRQMQLDKLAHYDTLTGLANRYYLKIALKNLLDKSKLAKSKNAVLFLDLDHFKQINDIFGHHEGDLLLQEAAQRIQSSVRTTDIVSRIGGDEFVIVLSRIQDKSYVLDICNNLIKKIRKPFYINHNEHNIGVSIGASLYPEHGKDIEELMSRADSAMYRSKKLGRNQASIFNPEDEKNLQEKNSIKNLLINTIKSPKNNLEVYYQPIINIDDGTLSSLEALLRIKDDKGNYINPEEVIEIAESESLISEFGELIFREICKFYSENKNAAYKIVPIAVNLSIYQFTDSLIEIFEGIAKEYELELNNFNFEVTETRAMENLQNIYETLEELSNKGCKISLDDFGTGYASLAQLHNLPINLVKIDKSFTFRIDNDKQARNMVRAMTRMTHEMGFKIIIEGVETKDNLNWLKKIGANYAQGYFFSKPLSSKEIREQYLK